MYDFSDEAADFFRRLAKSANDAGASLEEFMDVVRKISPDAQAITLEEICEDEFSNPLHKWLSNNKIDE